MLGGGGGGGVKKLRGYEIYLLVYFRGVVFSNVACSRIYLRGVVLAKLVLVNFRVNIPRSILSS